MTNAVKTWVLQLLFGAATVILLTLWHQQWFLSALLGAVSMIVASSYWVFSLWRIEKTFGKQKDKPKVLKAFYLGQLIKYAVIIALVLIYIRFFQLAWLAVIIGIVSVQLASSFLVFKTKAMRQ